jgi:branched-chain amino acid transport system permease protein
VLQLIAFSTLNGVLYGMLLFMMASGLTLIFSMMGVLNFAHASFYMLGAYFGFEISQRLGFWPGFFVAPLMVGAIGAVVERYGLRRVHKLGQVSELLFTFGLAFVHRRARADVLGKASGRLPDAAIARFRRLPALRMGERGLDDEAKAGTRQDEKEEHEYRNRRHDLSSLSHVHAHDDVFGVGATMAGLAGVIAGPALVTQPSMAAMLGPILFVVIVVGGLGSLTGAFLASLLIGLVQTFAVAMNLSIGGFFGASAPPYLGDLWQVTVAQLAPVIPYLMLVLMLIFRPTGLMGTRE